MLAVTVVALDADGPASVDRNHGVDAVQFAGTTEVLDRLSSAVSSHGET
jgi:hypothetical protein